MPPLSTSSIPQDEGYPLATAETYLQMYRDQGQQLVIKASGRELTPDKLDALARDIAYLTAQGIHSILIFGGGEQIDHEWGAKHPGIARPKIDGIGVTTDEVLHDAVLPAYTKIREELRRALPDFLFVDPKDIPCDQVPHRGWVGRPRGVTLPQRQNIAIGFVGTHRENPEQPMNMNADAIAERVAQYDQVGELFFLTNSGGVLDASDASDDHPDGTVVPIMLLSEMHPDGTHDHIEITGGMLQKTKEIYKILTDARSRIEKATIIKGSNLRREIEDWKGSGTLIFDPKKLHCSPATRGELTIFDSSYQDNVRSDRFRSRTVQELDVLRREHRIVRIGNSPVGGFSLHDGQLELFWAGYPKNGIGREVMEHAKRQATQMGWPTLYALSTPKDPSNPAQHQKLLELWEGDYKFRTVGRVSELRSDLSLPSQIRSYEHGKRDPYVFVCPLSQEK